MNPLFPSILATDFFDLKLKLDQLQRAGIDFIHLDIMDGHFVDNISFGPSLCSSLKKNYPFKIDAHLMVSNPQKIVPYFIDAGADWISVHLETGDHLSELIKLIKRAGKKAGLVINPQTDVQGLFAFSSEVDFILVMSVHPGFGGQKFIPASLEKIAVLEELRKREKLNYLIQVDGGLNHSNLREIVLRGADIFVIGSALYKAENIDEMVKKYLRTIQGAEK